MAILQNIFVKAIVVPIILAVAATLLEIASALVKGRCKEERKFRIWIRQEQADSSTTLVALLGQSLQDIRTRNDVVDIETMVSFDIADFGSLGIDLIIGAFAVDIASLIDARGDPRVIGIVLVGHILLLTGIVIFLMLSHHDTPEEQKNKRIKVAIAIGLGLFAMIVAFLAM